MHFSSPCLLSHPLCFSHTGTLTSQTFLHYYLQAVSRCRFAGTAEDVIYCQQLANLCVLQLYDRASIACRDHLAIVAARSNQLYNAVNNWVTGMPWLYLSGDANTVCNTWAYKKRVTLGGLLMRFVLAKYHMNGTFAGTVCVAGSVLALRFFFVFSLLNVYVFH